MRNILILLCLLLSGGLLHGQTAGEAYYFFSPQDVRNMRLSAETDWGKPIADSLKQVVEERLTHSMEVPTLEGGHGHQYFCPIHNERLAFNWDKPTSHYCRQCGKEWNKDVRFNWAWVNLVHHKNSDFLDACAYLYLLTGNEQYARYITDLLLDYSLKYPTYMLHDIRRRQVDHQSGKMFGQSLDEAVFASYAARAYLTARPLMSEDEIRQIENGYLKPCAELLLSQKMRHNFWSKPNWQVWHNSGIAALGVALGNDSIIDIALNAPDKGYHCLMEKYVFDDGWWCEGSPVYHFYPLRAMLLTAEAVRCRGINLYDDKLHNMFSAPAAGTYPNLLFPAHNDGWYGESLTAQARLYEIACLRFDDKTLSDVLAGMYADCPRNSTEALLSNCDYSDRKVRSLKRQSINFPYTGAGMLRSGKHTVVLKYGPHENSHGHPDKLSIAIHDDEKEVVADLGTSAYGVPDFRRWYRRTLSHSTLSVDGKDQVPSAGTLITFKPNAQGGTIEATANDAYDGVDMRRRLTLKGNKLTDTFTAQSLNEHTYDWVLTLTEKPVFDLPSVPAELHESEVYECVRKVQKADIHQAVTLAVGTHRLTIQSLQSDDFELFWGEAPGVPKSKLAPEQNNPKHPETVYTLIVRTKGKQLDIHAVWQFHTDNK